ncbi:MAG: CehA/McbA family metallohydrolase [Bradymonadaceae bacterium]
MKSRQIRTLTASGLIVFILAITGACTDCDDTTVGVEDVAPDALMADVAPDGSPDVPGPADVELDVSDVPDAGPTPEFPRTPIQDGVSDDGHSDISEVLGEGEVRLGRLLSDDTGFHGVDSHCRKGDFLLYNSLIVVCIQEESTNRLESFTGGMIVDARRVGDEGEDVLDFILPLMELRTATAREVSVIRDGTDGLAVLRVVGKDMEIAFLAAAIGGRLGSPMEIEVTTEYRLRPGEDSVEIVTWYTKPDGSRGSFFAGDLFVWGDRARVWSEGQGFGVGTGGRKWMAGVGDGRSFGLVYENDVSPLGIVSAQGLPWGELRARRISLEAGNEEALRRWFVVGDGTLDSMRSSAARLLGSEWEESPHTVEVLDEGGDPVSGVGVLVKNEAGRSHTYGVTGDDGRVVLALEAGATYGVVLEGLAGERTQDFPEVVFDTEGLVTLEVPQAGRLLLNVAEAGSEAPLTARVEVRGEVSMVFFAVQGALDVAVPAGDYRLVITRGPEYDYAALDIQVEAGGTSSEDVELVRTMETSGWRTGDFHQHMEPSPDSTIELRLRVLDNVASGVELIVPTDHDVVTDLQPIIDELGLEAVVSTFPGVEISPAYTHMNIFPIPYRPETRGRGTIELARMVDEDLVFRRVPEIIALARTMEDSPVVQLNHARNNSGFFAHTGYDPELGPDAIVHEDFSIDFDAMEIVNRIRDTCQLMKDWSGLLNAGKVVTGMGNSDSHHLNARAGVPRSYLRMDSLPGEITPALVKEAILNQRVTVGSHAFMDFADAMLPGDTIESSVGTSVSFRPRVQTPDWAEATRLFVIVNGRIVDTLESSGAGFDFDETIDLNFDEDSWVVFFAYGPSPSDEVRYSVPVIAFTNPVFIDVDGSGWQAPGVGELDLDALNQDGFCG